jgi:hypothetical protein
VILSNFSIAQNNPATLKPELKFNELLVSTHGLFPTPLKLTHNKTQTATIAKPDSKQTAIEFSDLCAENEKYLKFCNGLKFPRCPCYFCFE